MIFIGVDAGGSNCRCRIQDGQGRILGEGKAGQANLRIGTEKVIETIRQTFDMALVAASLSADDLGAACVCVGIAGIERMGAGAPFLAQDLGCKALRVESDAVIANVGSHQGGDGATVIVGTGSIGVLKMGDTMSRIGGHGFPVSDEGSGAYIGLLAMRMTLRAFDGLLPQTALVEDISTRFDGERPKMLAWLDQATPRDFAALAPTVVRHADAHDEVAVAIMENAADQIAQMLKSLIDAGAPRLALQGGLGPIIRQWLPADISERLSDPLGDPLSGALILARHMASKEQ